MAQKMSGRDSAPIARDNSPVTVFAKDGKAPVGAETVKAAKASAVAPASAPTGAGSVGTPPTPATGTPAPQPAAPAATAATPAAAKPVAPKGKALDDVVARQTRQYDRGIVRHFVNRTRERMAAGQPQADAIADVLAFYAAKANEAIAASEPTK